MLIYWKVKTLRNVQDNNRKKLNISAGKSDKSSNSTGDIHLGFVLLKRNTEHNHAIQKLSEAVGNISLIAIGYAGNSSKHFLQI
jgi:tRNA(Glu) U13 pseudouridine synthase TruD